MKINNRWKIILIATLFNLLWEYHLRGVNDFSVHPRLPLYLFLTYFSYFTIVEDVIARFRLKDYQVFIVALFLGLLWQLVGPSVIYFPPLVMGINWLGVIFVNFIWWVPIQTLMAFYIANRITPRDWNHPLLSRAGWGLAFFTFVFITFLSRLLVPNFPPITLQQLVIMLALIIATGALFREFLPSIEERLLTPPAFKKDKVMDYLSTFATIFFFFSAFFLTSNPSLVGAIHLNRTALRVSIVVSTMVVLTMFIRRLSAKKPIPV